MSSRPDSEPALLQEVANLRREVVRLERQVRELTGREQAAARSAERLYTMLMNMPVMIDAFDGGGNIVLWNRECERVSGYAADEIVGNPKAMELLYPNPAYRERMMREWRERGDDYRNWRWDMTARDGSVKTIAWYNVSERVPIASWSTWGVGVEITEQRKTEDALQESERELADIFENVPVGIYRTSPDGRTLMANPAFVRMLGYYSFRELARQNLEKVSLDVQYTRAAFKRQLEEKGRVLGLESTWKRRDGSTLHAIENARIVRDARGNVLYYEGTIEDITERVRTEAALRESENKYRALVEGAGETIAVVNEGGVFLFMNATAAKRLGGEPKDYVGKTMWDLFPGEIADRQVTSIRTVIQTGDGMNVIVPTVIRGQPRWYNTTIVPLKDATAKISSALVIGRDIHELRQTQQELEQYRSHMARTERLAALGTVSASVAHEMNQPLTVIRLTIEDCLAELEENGSVQRVVSDLEDCLKEVSAAASITDRFKGFARHSHRRNPTWVSLQRTAERVVRLWEEPARTSRISLSVQGLKELPRVYVDERDLEQLFFSLVENAIQAADGGKDRRLLITGKAQETSVDLRFADTCGGIAPEHLDKIFQAFFSTKVGNRGTGLGLSIVEQVVQRAGGRIAVDNQPGEGVTFIVTLPLAGPNDNTGG